MNSKQVVNQFGTLDNIRDNVESGQYEFRGGKAAFNNWCWDVANNKAAFSQGKVEAVFISNKDLLDEADKEMSAVRGVKK